MPARTAEAEWKGDLIEGAGKLTLGSGAFSGPYSFRSRTADGPGTNPEELLGAAHAGCFSMAFAAALTQAGIKPERIHTTAKVFFEKQGDGFAIPRIELTMEASVPGLDEAAFQQYAEGAKKGCPVSKALAGVDIHLDAKLIK
jgi:osmotically inducible protein OsmC